MRGHRNITFVVGAGLALSLLGSAPPAPARAASQPVAQSQPSQPTNSLVSLTLAKGIKSASLFGQGELSPVEPTTTFVTTDLPYAVLKFKALQSNTSVSVRVNDPSGPAFTIDVKVPQHRDNVWSTLDLGLPLFILGTDLETHTGTWTIQVLFNGQPATTATFQWTAASPIQLGKIRDLSTVDPTNADLHWRYGAALILLGHQAEGVAEIQNAIKLDQRYALYYITLGRVYEREGKSADAVKMFQTALSLHGSYYDAVYASWAQAHLARLKH